MRKYTELLRIPTYEERFEYLQILGSIGIETFGFDRYLNQTFYTSEQWKRMRSFCIARDLGNDMAFEGRPIAGRVLLHHMNPITPSQLAHGSFSLLDPENLVCVSHQTHNAIHFGSKENLQQDYIPRKPNDHILW